MLTKSTVPSLLIKTMSDMLGVFYYENLEVCSPEELVNLV